MSLFIWDIGYKHSLGWFKHVEHIAESISNLVLWRFRQRMGDYRHTLSSAKKVGVIIMGDFKQSLKWFKGVSS